MGDWITLISPEPSELYRGHYDPLLVTLSLWMAILGFCTALLVLSRTPRLKHRGERHLFRILAGAIAGAGLWGMHFIALLALRLPCETTFDGLTTALSMIPALLVGGGITQSIPRERRTRARLLRGGFLMALGVSLMHAIGLSGYRIEGHLLYDGWLIGPTFMASVALVTAALGLSNGWGARGVPGSEKIGLVPRAALMGLLIAGMPYGMMTATYFVRSDQAILILSTGSPFPLAAWMTAIIGILALLTLLALFIREIDTDEVGIFSRWVGLLMLLWSGLAWYLVTNYNNQWVDQLFQRQYQTAEQLLTRVRGELAGRLQMQDQSAALIARMIRVRDLLSQPPGRVAGSDSPLALIEPLLTNQSHETGALLYLVDARGHCAAACGPTTADLQAEPWWPTARAGGVARRTPGADARLIRAYPVLNQRGDFLGAVVVDYDLHDFKISLGPADFLITDLEGHGLLDSLSGDPARLGARSRRGARSDGWDEFPQEDQPLPEHDDLYRSTNRPWPFIRLQQVLADHQLHITIRYPVPMLERIQGQRLGWFTLLMLVGVLVIQALNLIRLYERVTQRRREIQQESRQRIGQAMIELEREQRRLVQLIEFSPVSLAFIETDGRVSIISQSMQQLTGYALSDCPDWEDWIKQLCPDPQYRKEVVQDMAQRLNGNGEKERRAPGPGFYRLTMRNGEERQVEVHGVELERGGTLIAIIDLTDRVEAEQARLDDEARYRTLYENSHDAIVILSPENRFVDFNAKALRLLGLGHIESARGRHFAEVAPPRQPEGGDSRQLIDAQLKRALDGQLCHFEWQFCRRDGTLFPVDMLLSAFRVRGDSLVQATIRDITEIKRAREQLDFLAYHDSLTGLPNRTLFFRRFEQSLKRAASQKECLALLFIDLDDFKPVNDRHGHAIGDLLLREVGQRMQRGLRQSDLIGRVGGDEFVVLVHEVGDVDTAHRVASQIRRCLEKPFMIAQNTLTISCSIGIALYPEHGSDPTELAYHADLAMYQVKSQGGRGTQAFQPDKGEKMNIKPVESTSLVPLLPSVGEGATPVQGPKEEVPYAEVREGEIDIFPWNENFRTGIEEIDRQHQGLIEIINRLASQVAFQSDLGSLNQILDSLVDYTRAHFETEERYWNDLMERDEDAAQHHGVHQQFIDKVTEVRGLASRQPIDLVVQELLGFLTHWLTEHILQSDRYLARRWSSMKAGRPVPEARAEAQRYMQESIYPMSAIILTLYDSLTANTLHMIREMGQRKKAEQALVAAHRIQQESLGRIRMLLDSSPDAVIMVDEDDQVIGWNGQAHKIFGYTESEALGRELSELIIPPSYREAHRRGVALLIGEKDLKMVGKRVELLGMRSDGSEFPIELTIGVMVLEDGRRCASAYVRDITGQKDAEARIEKLSFYDQLTGLPNRKLLNDRLQQAIAQGRRHRTYGALLLIDLDNFKGINDTLGHGVGDQLLQQVAMRLSDCAGQRGTVSRVGGDEFALMLNELGEGGNQQAAIQLERVGQQILGALSQPYAIEGRECQTTPSIGVVMFGDEANSSGELMKRADIALHQAKQDGRSQLRFYDSDMQRIFLERTEMESDLRGALARKELQLYYQKLVDGEGRTVGAEALIRWNHPKRGLVSPLEFIPLAEESALIIPIGLWVIETACRQLMAWEGFPRFSELTLAINVSASQFHDSGFIEDVSRILKQHEITPGRLKIELTESVMLADTTDTTVKMNLLKEKGIQFALDDFGTGYSSLSYLTRLPLNQLKIDQSFVSNIGDGHSSDDIVIKTIIGMASSLGLKVVAEGVETSRQQQFLSENGCHHFQGYLFGKPVPIEEFEHQVH